MIRIHRGPEPSKLSKLRNQELPKLRKIARRRSLVTSDIAGYQIVGVDLWRAQYYKCCYCEHKIKKEYNDVEHYRPKICADRRPGCKTKYGYWWLSFSWENLLFACPSCNRTNKNVRFPLCLGDVPLRIGDAPPGRERPCLIDPSARVNPVQHIQFVYSTMKSSASGPGGKQWFARPRNGSVRGALTIDICGLNDGSLLELRKDHVDELVRPQVRALNVSLARSVSRLGIRSVQSEFDRARGMFAPQSPYAALTYDAFRHFVPNIALAQWGLTWPPPRKVGR